MSTQACQVLIAYFKALAAHIASTNTYTQHILRVAHTCACFKPVSQSLSRHHFAVASVLLTLPSACPSQRSSPHLCVCVYTLAASGALAYPNPLKLCVNQQNKKTKTKKRDVSSLSCAANVCLPTGFIPISLGRCGSVAYTV